MQMRRQAVRWAVCGVALNGGKFMTEAEKYEKIMLLEKQKNQVIGEAIVDDMLAEQLNVMGKQFHNKAQALIGCFNKDIPINDSCLEELQEMLIEIKDAASKETARTIKSFELQPLRISTGWKVAYNMFSEYDPDTDGSEYAYELCEDLLQLSNNNLLLDLGWYPQGDITGSYKLYLVDKTKESPFESPLEAFVSKSKQEVIKRIEYWTNYGFFSKYLH